MKLYHATRQTYRNSASEIAEQIVEDGFEARFDYNHQAEVVCLAAEPLRGWGGGGMCDAWVEVEVPQDVTEKFQYHFDDDLYGCACYAFPEDAINQFPRLALTASEIYE